MVNYLQLFRPFLRQGDKIKTTSQISFIIMATSFPAFCFYKLPPAAANCCSVSAPIYQIATLLRQLADSFPERLRDRQQ